MSDTKKYVVYKRDGIEKAVTFPSFKNHDNTAFLEFGIQPAEVVSAGFFYEDKDINEIIAFGKSMTLHVESRESEDVPLIKAAIS